MSTHSGNRMYDLTRSKSCSLHTSCFGEPRIPSAQTSRDIGAPIEPKHPCSAPMAFKKMSSEELRLAKLWHRRSRGAFRGRVVRSPAGVWPARGRPSEFASESRSVVCVLFGLSEMTSRDARGVVMEKESREARQSARNTVIL